MSEKVKNGQFIKKWQIAVFAFIYLISILIDLFLVIVTATGMLSLQLQYVRPSILWVALYTVPSIFLVVVWIAYRQYRRGWKFNLLLIPVVYFAIILSCEFGARAVLDNRTLVNEFLYDKHVYLMVEYNSSSRDLAAYKCNEWGMFCERISNEDYERVRVESRRE